MPKNSNSLGIIPARFSSSRFPGKPLADIKGQSMVMRVYNQALRCQSLSLVVVATDDELIFRHVQHNGGNVVMTSTNHVSGTDRCAEVVGREEYEHFDLVVNIQGDEPLIEPMVIEACIDILKQNTSLGISTLAQKILQTEDLTNPNIVKVLLNKFGNALYFSRAAVPHQIKPDYADWLEKADYYKHLGLYGFRRETLLELSKLKLGKLEQVEQLEQLRWLENGYEIGVSITEHDSYPVDVPEDIEKIRQLLNKG